MFRNVSEVRPQNSHFVDGIFIFVRLISHEGEKSLEVAKKQDGRVLGSHATTKKHKTSFLWQVFRKKFLKNVFDKKFLEKFFPLEKGTETHSLWGGLFSMGGQTLRYCS